jgi:nucleoside-diphosphate kinase
MSIQRTLVLCKPDTVQRGLVGRVVSRFEEKGLKLVGMKMLRVDESLAGRHYAEHVEKPFYPDLLAFITASPIVSLAVEGDNAVEVVRNLMGVTNPQKAESGTLRGDFGLNLTMNLVHGSDSLASAQRELALFFAPEEIHDYESALRKWT